MKIAKNILQLIGHTPLMEVQNRGYAANVWAKLESFNPGGSSKDRIGLVILEDAEGKGLLKPGSVIVEPTSGNTGIGLAIAARVMGYRLILTMPDTMSEERRKLLMAYGAELVLTPGNEGLKGAVEKAKEIAASMPNSFMPQQFSNPANATAHYYTSGWEIWTDTDGTVDILVAGIGTGGTITGTGRRLRELKPEVQIIGVEPAASPLLTEGWVGPHKLQGMGANFIPEVLDQSLLNEVIAISDEDAMAMCRSFAETDGVLVGISGGASLAAAFQVAARPENSGKNIVTIIPDSGMKYLSMHVFSEDPML